MLNMSRENVIKINTALLVFALSSAAGTIFWGGQIFEKLANVEKKLDRFDSIEQRATEAARVAAEAAQAATVLKDRVSVIETKIDHVLRARQ